MEIRKGPSHCLRAPPHLVLSPSGAAKVLNATHLRRLQEIFRSVCADFEAELKEFNGEHLLVMYPRRFGFPNL
jgi:putative transposase